MEFVPAILLFLVAYLISAGVLFAFFSPRLYPPVTTDFILEAIFIFTPVLNTLILMVFVLLLLLFPTKR